jgi:hypothetical protein
MRKTIVVILVCLLVAVCALAIPRPQSTAVKVCRADAQKFSEENASYHAEYDTLYGATTLAQRQIKELFDRDKELTSCLQTDPGKSEMYIALIREDGDIEGMRYLKFLLDTNQTQDFAEYERRQQAIELEKYRNKN